MQRFSIVIPTYNEGPDLEATIALVRASIPRPYEIIVVDDCSDPPIESRMGSFPDVKVTRLEKRSGVSPAKRIGCEHATGDVFIILDSHMRMPTDWLATIDEARQFYPHSIMCAVCRGFASSTRFIGAGAMFSNDRDLFLGRKWLNRGQIEAVDRVPCLLGACYVVPRVVWDALGGINPNLVGWGYNEQDLSLRAWMTGYEVRCINSLVVPHRFNREPRPNGQVATSMSTWHNEYNAYVTAATVFEEGVFERLYSPYFKQVYREEALEEFEKNRDSIMEFRERVQVSRRYSDDELFALCGFKLPTPMEQRAKVAEIKDWRETCRENKAQARETELNHEVRPEIGRSHRLQVIESLPDEGRMLEWGSGGSTTWFREHMKPKQELVTIEHNIKWAQKIGGCVLHELRISSSKSSAEMLPDQSHTCLDISVPYVACSGLGRFDVILVDGVLRNACLMRCVDLLKTDGRVFLHDGQRSWYEAGKAALEWHELLAACDDYPGSEMWIGKLWH